MKLAYYIKKNRLKGDSRVESLLGALRAAGHQLYAVAQPSDFEAGTDVLTAEALNDHARKKMSVSGTFRDEPCGTGEEGVRYDDTATWSGTLQFDEEGIVVTYTEEPDNQVLFDVNTGHWQETSTDYIQLEDDLYTIYEAKITDNAYRPADPAHPGLVFIGWTTNADIAAQRDFSTD